MFVGLAPGWEQMRLPFEACRDALLDGMSDKEASARAKATAFLVGMRQRITFWLDDLGVACWLGLDTTASLLGERSHLLHTTSAEDPDRPTGPGGPETLAVAFSASTRPATSMTATSTRALISPP